MECSTDHENSGHMWSRWTVEHFWDGIGAGKAHHWAVAIDADGNKLLSRKVVNDEAEVLDLIADVCPLADEVRWAVDISGRPSALLLALLLGHGQKVVYVPGRTEPSPATTRPTPRTPGPSPIPPEYGRISDRWSWPRIWWASCHCSPPTGPT